MAEPKAISATGHTPKSGAEQNLAGSRYATPVSLYLDLLKRSLTDTLFVTEPDVNQENRAHFRKEFIDHYIIGTAISMLPLVRFDNLQSCMLAAIQQGIPGDFIETGVWRGGATIFMRGVLKALNVTDRVVWVADSFEGLPQPDAEKFPIEADAHNRHLMKKVYNHLAVGLDAVRQNFAAYGLLDDQVRFLQGWFKDTLPVAPIEQLAVLRLDGDYYESTSDALTHLYPKLSVGGFAIIDDYGETEWTYCWRAVDEFRQRHGISEPMIRVDSRCYYWRRER